MLCADVGDAGLKSFQQTQCRPVIERSVDTCFQAGTDPEKAKQPTEKIVPKVPEKDECSADSSSVSVARSIGRHRAPTLL